MHAALHQLRQHRPRIHLPAPSWHADHHGACTLQRGLLFILRPRFWKPVLDIDAKDIAEARADLPLLAKAIQRDVQLGWWRT